MHTGKHLTGASRAGQAWICDPVGKDAVFAQECFGCHTPMKNNDDVFTHPAKLP